MEEEIDIVTEIATLLKDTEQTLLQRLIEHYEIMSAELLKSH